MHFNFETKITLSNAFFSQKRLWGWYFYKFNNPSYTLKKKSNSCKVSWGLKTSYKNESCKRSLEWRMFYLTMCFQAQVALFTTYWVREHSRGYLKNDLKQPECWVHRLCCWPGSSANSTQWPGHISESLCGSVSLLLK